MTSAAASPLARLPDGAIHAVLAHLDARTAETLGRALPPLLPLALRHSRDRLAALRRAALAALRPLVDKFKRALYAEARQQVLQYFDADSLCLVDTGFYHAGLEFDNHESQSFVYTDSPGTIVSLLSWDVYDNRPTPGLEAPPEDPMAEMNVQLYGRRGGNMSFSDPEVAWGDTTPAWIVPARLALSMACAEFNRVPVHFVSHHRAAPLD